MGWYIGRYENGVRHGLGQDVMIVSEGDLDPAEHPGNENVVGREVGLGQGNAASEEASDNSQSVTDYYRMIPRVYNKGHLLRASQGLSRPKVVRDILSNLDFFGFMGLLDQEEDDFEADSVDNTDERKERVELNRRLNLEVHDRGFPETDLSISDTTQIGQGRALAGRYQGLSWRPVRSHLFSSEFESTLCYDASSKALEFNKYLSSIIAIISQYPAIMRSYFPQTRMYFAQDDDLNVDEVVELDPT